MPSVANVQGTRTTLSPTAGIARGKNHTVHENTVDHAGYGGPPVEAPEREALPHGKHQQAQQEHGPPQDAEPQGEADQGRERYGPGAEEGVEAVVENLVGRKADRRWPSICGWLT